MIFIYTFITKGHPKAYWQLENSGTQIDVGTIYSQGKKIFEHQLIL